MRQVSAAESLPVGAESGRREVFLRTGQMRVCDCGGWGGPCVSSNDPHSHSPGGDGLRRAAVWAVRHILDSKEFPHIYISLVSSHVLVL